jgi:hypothetical protein
VTSNPALPFDKVFNESAAWYSGDFHAHTSASSDGEYPPKLLVEIARVEGLDFLSITDHNTIRGLTKLGDDLDFLVIPGMEFTLDRGHFNVFGVKESHTWLEQVGNGETVAPLPDRYATISELLAHTAGEGLLNSINHPLLHPWHWQFSTTNLGFVHCVELWNDLYWPGNKFANPKTVDLWTNWLNAGFRVTAIGGSDYHYPPKPELGLPGERLTQPTTYVYAENLSAASVMEGVRKGRVYITKGPKIELLMKMDGKSFNLGDNLNNQAGVLDIVASIDHSPNPVILHLIKNGKILSTHQAHGPQANFELQLQVDPTNPAWIRLEVLDIHWEILTITNPIFFNYQENNSANSQQETFWRPDLMY